MADRAERPTRLRLLPPLTPPPDPVTPGMLAAFRRGAKASDNPPALIVYAVHEAEFKQLMTSERLSPSRVVWCADQTSAQVVDNVFRYHGRQTLVITVGVAALEPGRGEGVSG